MKRQYTMKIVQIAILSAISTLLYLPIFSFPLSFIFPQFLEIQFSNLPALIGGFAIGPVGGCLIIIIKTVLKLFLSGTTTSYVGEMADIIIGCILVLSTSLIYKKIKSKKGALISLGIGCLVWVVSAVIANGVVLVPFYIELFMGGNVEVFVKACSVIPGINEGNYMTMYLIFGAGLFNLVLSIITSVITFFIYKRISILFDKME
ncbi:MAG: ECF transporter S component [Bacilli bacterium]|nr:ECF transporter S component [Bacilli bacterium]